MSRETALARGQAEHAEREWRDHKRECSRCSAAARQRHWDGLCPMGTGCHGAHAEAQRELAENRRLDKLPAPDQQPLF